MITRNVTLKGSQSLATERIIKAKKPRGGPGRTGKMDPAMPTSARRNPRMMKTVDKICHFYTTGD